jgi:hypothetical protein
VKKQSDKYTQRQQRCSSQATILTTAMGWLPSTVKMRLYDSKGNKNQQIANNQNTWRKGSKESIAEKQALRYPKQPW